MISDSEKRKALTLYVDEVPIKKIAEEIGCSRNAVYNWRDEGLFVEEDTWKEYRNKLQTVKKSNDKAEELKATALKNKEIWDEEAKKLRTAMSQFSDSLANGEVDMEVSDYEALYKVLMRIQNRGEELQMHMERFMKKVYVAIVEVLDVETAEAIKAKMEELEYEILSEYDPEQAKTTLNTGSNIEVE